MAYFLDTFYYQIPGSQPEATFGAVMEMLLKTRLKLHMDTNHPMYDEDVNAYLAGLLVYYIDPKYFQAVSPVLSHYDIDVYQAVAKAEDRVHVYWIYKVNADDLLVSLGVFHRLWQEEKGELARIKRYYSYASAYQRRIYGKATAVGEIQAKLAECTERYLTILGGVRNDYLHFMESINPEQMSAFTKDLQELEEELPLRVKRDEFLDAYSSWLRGNRDASLRQRLVRLIEELKQEDPAFLPSQVLSQLGLA